MKPPDFVFSIIAKDGIMEFSIEGDDHIISMALLAMIVKNNIVYDICKAATQIFDETPTDVLEAHLARIDFVFESETGKSISDN